MDNAQIVKDFFAEWGNGNMLASMDKYLADDAVWKNSGFPDCEGKAACIKFAEWITDMVPVVRVEFLSFAADGDLVFGERIDHCIDAEGNEVMTCPLNGAMRLRDGKIVYWYDYFDPRPFPGIQEI